VVDGLAARFDCLEPARFAPAGLGRDRDLRVDGRVRGDRICWIECGHPATDAWLAWAERLRCALNHRLFLGLHDFESHFAWYPAGAGYRRHSDAFRGQAGRVVTTVLYLNREWRPGDGGELVLYGDAGIVPVARIAPDYATLVLFLSAEFPHEVLDTARARRSVTGWFRIREDLRR
jgi:SM-20-related protein